ncbi:Fur family transcriptional regulator [Idiomarina aminovorans]|uniref:Fur family transcriptional regulator n=1 Tax=Idiomarina aminovorans TaxID=2914829 RepID=UPI0020054621|nr:transcriptional repressor [Idiomarina sp. ATCH4]MCK7460174.1 transcriptional repressor [Idiomarina sp. ATCH4]
MHKRYVDNNLRAATEICEAKGCNFTQKRQRVLKTLLEAERPLSAYEITDNYNAVTEPTISAVSVYRILEFLESIKLAYRLRSASKYIACKNITKYQGSDMSFFLICRNCQCVNEIEVSSKIVTSLAELINKSGFFSSSSQVEINSLCADCKATHYDPLKE